MLHFCPVIFTALLLSALSPRAFSQTSTPEDFEITTFASGFEGPVALAAAPKGRLFVAERGGAIFIVENGTVRTPPFAELEVYDFAESGLLGMTLDPNFCENRYVYVFATTAIDEQRIVRFTEIDGVATDLTVIRDNLPTTGQVHNGGSLRFGPDGFLYFGIGDTGTPELSQQLHTYAGKICRIASDGSTPPDNPLTTPTGTPRAIYALGLRNPFRACFAPDGRLFVMDVGSNGDARREEINLITAGANYGWPDAEGMSDSAEFPNYTDPVFAYHDEGSSIAGCVVYDGAEFPAEFAGDLFHLDFVSGGLFRLKLEGDAAGEHSLFLQADGGPVDLAMGPQGSLYYAELFTGDIKRIRYRHRTSDAPAALPPVGGEGALPDCSDGNDNASYDLDGNTAPDSDTVADGNVPPFHGGIQGGPPRPTLCGLGLLPAFLLIATCVIALRLTSASRRSARI